MHARRKLHVQTWLVLCTIMCGNYKTQHDETFSRLPQPLDLMMTGIIMSKAHNVHRIMW